MNTKKAIKIAMINADINQKELAVLSAVSETTISHTISGKTSPNVRTLAKLAKGCGISYSDLSKLGEG